MKLIKFLSFLSFSQKIEYLIGRAINTILDFIPNYKNIAQLHNLVSIAQNQLAQKVEQSNIYYKINGKYNILLRKNSSDFDVYYQIFFLVEYKPVVDFIKNELKIKITSIIDLGANIGLSSLYFNHHFPDANILAVEPDSGNFNSLLRNTEVVKNISRINAAVWSKNATLEQTNSFRDGRNWSTAFSEISKVTDTNTTINVVTIPELIKKCRPNEIILLKIDIEGAERFIFSNDVDLSFLNEISVIALEIHDEIADRNQIQLLLRNYNFIIFDYNETSLAVKKHLIN